MKAETNDYTQLCDKCHRLMRSEEIKRFTSTDYASSQPPLTFGWYAGQGTWMNQVCVECHLALRLEGAL